MEFRYFNTYDTFDIWRKKNNVSREKLELYHDFVISLDVLIEETFLGYDVIDSEQKVKEHFTWCWNKIISNFEKENIHFKKTGAHFAFFLSFFQSSFYDKKREISESREQFENFFNVMIDKKESDLDILLMMYKIFEKNFKN